MSALSPELFTALQQMSMGAGQQPTRPDFATEIKQLNDSLPFPAGQSPAPQAVSAATPVPQPTEQPASMEQGPNRGLSPYLQASLGALENANGASAKAAKKAEKATVDAGNAEKTAIKGEAEAKAQTAAGLVRMDQELADLQTRHQAEQANLQADVEKRNNQQLDVLNKAQQTYATDVANQKGFWADKGVGNRIGWAIAVGLGGFGASVTHTQNGALQILEAAIADDTRLKERKLAGEKGAIDTAQNSYELLRQSGLDRKQALVANQVLGLQAAQTRLKAYLDGRQGPEAQANAQTLMAQIDAKIAEHKTQFAQLTSQRQQQFAQGMSHIMGTAAELEDRAQQRDLEAQLAMVKARDGKAHIPGDIGFTEPPNEKQGEELSKRAAGARAVVADVDKFKKMFGTVDANGQFHFDGRGSAAAELLANGGYAQIVDRLVRNKMTADGDGARMTPEMIANAKAQIGLPDSAAGFLAAPERYLNLLNRYVDSTKNAVEIYGKGIGVQPVVQNWWDPDQLDVGAYLKGGK